MTTPCTLHATLSTLKPTVDHAICKSSILDPASWPTTRISLVSCCGHKAQWHNQELKVIQRGYLYLLWTNCRGTGKTNLSVLGRSARPVKQICAIHHLKSKMSILAIRTQNTEHCPIHIEAEAFWFPCRSTMLCSKYQQEGATPVSFLTSHNSHQDVVPLASLLHCASVGVFVCVRDSYTYNDTGNIETNEKTNSLLSRTHHILPWSWNQNDCVTSTLC